MAGEDRVLAGGAKYIDFQTDPSRYRHWKLDVDGRVATLTTVVNGTAAGGGYELALATDHIMLADDGSAAVSLPEVPLLAVLPGTGGLTRVVDKRKVRRDHADYFCTIEEGIKGKRAVAWRLVDEIVPNSKLEAKVAERAKEFAAASKRNGDGKGIALAPLNRTIDESGIRYGFVSVDIDRAQRIATISIKAPEQAPPADIDGLIAQGASFWPLQVARELDDAILHLRINELETAMLVFKSHGDRANATIGTTLDAEAAEELGLVTFALDDIDWDDEVRVFFEERTSFSPDGLTGMEANLRFVGPETMESKIFSRLTAWQNWIFQRPNAVGEAGALRRYGTGQKAQFDMTRV